MHQDQRIGLALGVLLVGACAAFFFRNETRTTAHAPRLQHARELDDRISERATRPYMNGVEVIETADRQRSRAREDQEAADSDHRPNYWSPLEPTSVGQFSGDKPFRGVRARGQLSNGESDVEELSPIAIPHVGQELENVVHGQETTGADTAKNRQPPKSAGSTGDSRTHVVQKGETLSSIAAKTLGSPNRFHELFEANQDQLKDPNDLKLGMTLRIPNPHAEAAIKSTISKHRPVVDQPIPVIDDVVPARDALSDSAPPIYEAPAVPQKTATEGPAAIMLPPELPGETPVEDQDGLSPSDDPSGARKFVPARRMQPPGRPAGPQASRAAPPKTGGRKLSQISLESTSGKVAR